MSNIEATIQPTDRPRATSLADAGSEGRSIEELPVIIIEPRHGWRFFDFSELYQYRDLFLFLTWRSIKVRYAQSAIGIGWAIIQPVFSMLVFNIVLWSINRFIGNKSIYLAINRIWEFILQHKTLSQCAPFGADRNSFFVAPKAVDYKNTNFCPRTFFVFLRLAKCAVFLRSGNSADRWRRDGDR